MIECKDMNAAHSRCFACGSENPDGLNLRFIQSDDGSVTATFTVPECYQGYPGVVQGGIVATVLDSAMTNCLFSLGVEAMTASLEMRFRAPVQTDVPLTVVASITEHRGRVYDTQARITQGGTLKVTASARFVVNNS